ncbi:MAG: extracellular solute-binding protein [Treponema sp.]|jgi:multiple sugar transport system substrate-binding protein|nr:extracellular solute-binding protein [Treponema sp.]
MYSKNNKKSMFFDNRIDIFIIIFVLILILSPVMSGAVSRLNAKSRQKDIYISTRCEEIFGGKTMETLVQDFERQNPDLRIKLLNVSGEKNKEPDILFFDEGEFDDLAAAGTLLPLDSFFEVETGVHEPAIPLVSFMDLLFYNIELLQAAGFDRPPKTRDEFLVYAKTVSAANNGVLADAAGAAMSLSPLNRQSLSRDIFSWIWAAGGNFWHNEDSAPVINTRPIINDFDFLGRLYREEALAPNSFEMTGEQALEDFAHGKIAMIVASTRTIQALREKMGDEAFGITTIPGAGTAGKYSIGLTGIFAGINKNCAYPDAAGYFLEFLAGQRALFCAQLKAVPGDVSDLFSGDYKSHMKDDPFYAKAWDIFESSIIVRGFLGEPGAQEYENAAREEIQLFFESGRTAQETAAAIQQRWDKIFED